MKGGHNKKVQFDIIAQGDEWKIFEGFAPDTDEYLIGRMNALLKRRYGLREEFYNSKMKEYAKRLSNLFKGD